MGTLRTDDDVNDALKAAATKQKVSATKLANDILRAALDGRPIVKPVPRPANGGGRGGGRASSVRPPAIEQTCPPHPPGRVIGGTCMACGTVVKKA